MKGFTSLILLFWFFWICWIGEFFKSQDEKPQPELELDFFLSQLHICIFLPLSQTPQHERPQEEANVKATSCEQRWHDCILQDARALMILLQVKCVEPNTRNVTFGGIFEGFNDDQYSCCLRFIKGSRGHQGWLEGPVNPLTKVDRPDYLTLILRRILKFLHIE